MVRRPLAATIAAAFFAGPLALIPVTTAAHADGPGFIEVPVSIPATQPDDEGNPVTLDGGVDIPTTGCPCPVVLINHGFLGTWHDSEDVATTLAEHGYVVLRYSSRGFGKTPGEVDLVGPKETQDLLDAVHWINSVNPDGSPKAAPIAQLDGKVIPNDVGQYGGSYGGGHAWAAAMSGDPAIRTVIPTATWTDFYQALLPNDVMLAAYANGFYATGYDPTAGAINSASNQDNELSTTQNYSLELHRWMAEANSGVDIDDIKAGLDSRSVMYNIDKVKIPVFIVQGTNDGLFTANQALAAYNALKGRVPVRLYLGGIGHPPSNGSTSSPEALHVGAEMLMWFDHYLKGVDNGIDRMPPIEYSHTTYFNNTWTIGKGTKSAYDYPLGAGETLDICTSDPTGGTLTEAGSGDCPSAPPAVAVNVPAGSGYDQEPVTASDIHEGLQELTGCGEGSPTCQQNDPDLDSAPQVLTYNATPVAADTEYVGIPKITLQVGSTDVSPATQEGAVAAFQLDPKLYDVAPDGTATLITRGAYAQPLNATEPSPTTIPSHPVSYDAFGMSYVIPKGDHLRVTFSTSDVPYLRPTVNPFAVVLFAGSTITMPTAERAFTTPALGDSGPGQDLPEAPYTALLAIGGLAVVGLTLRVVHRRRRYSTA